MPLIETKGAASAQGFGEFAASSGPVTYIENVFSTYLYTGTGGYQSITNNVDLAGKGGLVWIKTRNASTTNHQLFDTARGVYKTLLTNDIGPQQDVSPYGVYTFDSAGFTVGDTTNGGYQVNGSSPSRNYVSWTFRKQPKFFDVVTFNGNATARTIAHNLGSVPGCIMVKCITEATDWWVYHRSLGTNQVIKLNTTAAQDTSSTAWNNTAPTSTVFSIGDNGQVNSSGQTYVAYLFAHNAGGFGLTGTDNVISCGSYTGNGSNTNGTNVDLGYEPQWLLIKKSSSGTSDWLMVDNMRGMTADGTDQQLKANLAGAEDSTTAVIVKSTGFQLKATGNPNTSGETYIYIAIRRGPMKVPTTGTSVFKPNAYAGGTAGTSFNLGFVPDTLLTMRRNTSNFDILQSRLTGQAYMFTNTTDAELGGQSGIPAWDANTGTTKLTTATSVTGWNGSGSTYVNEAFARAPGFFDEVCYPGAASPNPYLVSHNLGVSPELIIIKARNNAINWYVWGLPLGIPGAPAGHMFLNLTDASATTEDQVKSVSSTTFGLKPNENYTSGVGYNYVAYLFATLAGVSKVGSYTGTGATQTISCGFTGGARFVLIKRTNSTGDWYVWDTARGMVAGTDPSLLLNADGAEVNANSIYSTTGGFQIVSTAAGINASGGTYIFLAIA